MHLTRIYYSGSLAIHQTIVLNQFASHHLIHVMRLTPNSPFIVFNGQGGEYQTHIATIENSRVTAVIDQYLPIERESALNIHLGQSLCRPDKMDWIIQKAVELGVNTISPLITERSPISFKTDRLKKKQEHWQNIIIHACEQSGRTRLPVLSSVIDFSTWLAQIKSDHKFILHTQNHEKSLSSYSKGSEVVLLIGPEGGWSEKEVQLATQHDFQLLNLGPRTLRVETAAVAALSVFQSHWGDLG